MKVTMHSCGPPVNESERKAFAQIKTRLLSEPGDDEWRLLTNVTFSATHQHQSDEIDIVAIGPPGVRVIEVKHWTAAWVGRHRNAVEREADRVTRKARKIGTTLRKKIACLKWVTGVFLITEEASKIKRLEESDPIRGVPFHTFKTWKDALGFGKSRVLSPYQIETACRILMRGSGAAADDKLKRMAGYVQLELQTFPDEHFHRVYRGIHSTRRDRVILHLYDWSANETPNAESKARREFDALHRLQLYPWAPRILDSFQETPGYTGESAFFTVVDPVAPCIEERASDDNWSTKARLSFARDAVRVLKQLHEAADGEEPMIHRNLTPQTILVKHDNSPILTGFEYTRIPSDVTVASAASKRRLGPTVAPEVYALGLGAADPRSDVYSLCASLIRLFEKRDDRGNSTIIEILSKGKEEDPGARSTLLDMEALLSYQLGESFPSPPPPSARFWTEDQVVSFREHDYRIVLRLGSGGVGTTFKVVKIEPSTESELGTYVAKVIRERERGQQVLKSYELAHSHLRHSALSTIFEVAQEWQDNNFIALMTWIDGSSLRDFSGVIPILAEDYRATSSQDLVLQWLRAACDALNVLHRNGLVHGDVSPRNMIVSNDGLVLTDYDCVGKIGERAVAQGTVLYSSPSDKDNRPAVPADDFYALAASFFHVLFEKEPFQYDGVQSKERGLNWTKKERAEYPALTVFLDQATCPDPKQRFETAEMAIAALDSESKINPYPRVADSGFEVSSYRSGAQLHTLGKSIEYSENEIPWLKSLLQSYPGSLWGNSETRGLDTEFAEKTYVNTDLEQELYRDIIKRRASLIILCGNAGDGKTALLQHLAKDLGLGEHKSVSRILEGTTHDGLTVRMNLDGSASSQNKSADKLLDEFLKPFQHGNPEQNIVHLLAVNDGRLLEWIEGTERFHGKSTQLMQTLDDLLSDPSASGESHIRFVNLNHRSLVGIVAPDGKSIDTNFLEHLVNSLYGGDDSSQIWTPCQTCSAQERCEIFRATRLFGPEGVPGEALKEIRHGARTRLFEALQAVHLRGETHITVRELRATLVYILFGIHFCSDYHSMNEHTIPVESYSDRAFSPKSHRRQGEVLRELVRFDPGLEAHSQIDRYLCQQTSDAHEHGPSRYSDLTLASARRRAYFEWSKEDIKKLTEDPYALGLAQGRHLREFRDLAVLPDSGVRADLTKRLCQGISRLEALPPQALRRDAVPLRITPRTPTETAFWAEKTTDAFRLDVENLNCGEGRGQLHRQAFLIYRYNDNNEEILRLGADLFHLLLDLSEGYQLGDVSSDDTFAHLSIFVRRLMREDHRRIFAWNPMDEETIYEISAKIEKTESEPLQCLKITPIENR